MRVDILYKSVNDKSPYVYKLRTNAPTLKIFYGLEHVVKGSFPHVGVTAREGLLVMYKRVEDKSWMPVNAYSRSSPAVLNMKYLVGDNVYYDLLIYAPILGTLSDLYLDVPEGSSIVSIEENNIDKIMIAGGIHSFGIGCTTSSMLFSNIIGRKTNSLVNNYSFNKSDFLKAYHSNYFKADKKFRKHDICILEVDSYSQKKEDVEKYLVDVVNFFKTKVNKLICWYALPPNRQSRKDLIRKLLKEYEGEIIIEDISCIYSDKYSDMCVYSNRFINDTANVFIYKKLSKWL
ncbi:hypothetical protein TL18_08590 [Methanobrevibacter sp. YE315]|uniref:hypothetical protein n=1 Tax=Methanobrevibacter sp. YE315 TaxID=1609968 RepID=UPI000764E0A8|nr:hypothetical protein [Methanobrevibacter sp. YE315]AMD18070.1 hypothetical protein TL18_08590 [Methanobrevibacter sp. YE315]